MLTYNNVTSAAWDAVIAEAAKMNITIGSDSGSASSQGFAVAWNYDRPARILALQCTDKPFFVSCSLINAHLNDAVERCLQSQKIAVTGMVASA
jgi:hypothetical protein